MEAFSNAKNDLAALDRYWQAANYLSVGQIYLLDNLCALFWDR
jgi:phosphoketolase